jgi:hypothetical protein
MPDIQRIIVTVQDGMIVDIADIPEGVEIEVRDYDPPEVDEGDWETDEDGDEYAESIWQASERSREPL